MASGRVLSHLLRLSSIPLLKLAAFSSLRYPSPVPFSRLKPAGFLLSRAVQYATSAPVSVDAAPPAKDPSAGPSGKITDEFTGGGAIGQVCQVDGTEEIVREQRVLNTGSPITYATYAVPPAKAPASPSAGPSSRITDEFIGGGAIGHICQVDGTEEIVREPRVLNTGSPITYATSATAAATASKAPASPSAGPSGKIADEFTGAGAIQQRHAGGDTYSDRDGVDGGTYSYCLTFSDIMYGEEYFIYGSDDDSDDII